MSRQRGFSLVELVLALAVLALLLGVALPLAAGARHAAREATCRGNLQLAIEAIDQYATASDGYFPAGEVDDATQPGAVNFQNLYGIAGTGRFGTLPGRHRKLNTYLAQPQQVARCPLDRGYRWNYTRAIEYYGMSYFYPARTTAEMSQTGWHVRAGVRLIEGLQVAEIEQPPRKLVLADTIVLTQMSASQPWHHWHSAGDPLRIMIAFADGHVDASARKQAHEAEGLTSNVRLTDKAAIDAFAASGDYY